MDYKKTAEKILQYVGGEDNVAQVTHCMTRLRFNLKDESIAKTDDLKAMDEVIGVVQRGGQYQVIIGTEVKNVFQEMEKLGDFKQAAETKPAEPEQKKKGISAILDVLSGIFTPLLPVLIASGMLKAVLTLLSSFSLVDTGGTFYYFLTFVADAGMYYLPVFAAYTSAKKFGANPFLSMFLVACLLHPDFVSLCKSGDPIKLFGLTVKNVDYSSNTIAAILSVWMLSYIEKFFYKYIPSMIRVIFAPTLTILVAFPLMFLFVAPLGAIIGDGLAYVFSFLNDIVPWLMPALWGALCPILVMCGMHYSLASIFGTMYTLLGYETAMMPGMFVANIAHGGATLAVAVKSKNKKMKQLAGSSAFTAVLGITEPALYGVTLKYKTPLLAAMIGGGLGGLWCGLTHVKAYAMSSPGLASIAMFIGGGTMTNFYNACIGGIIGFVSAFLIALLLKIKDPEEENTADSDTSDTEVKTAVDDSESSAAASAAEVQSTSDVKTSEISSETTCSFESPLTGTVVPLKEVPDDVFATGMMGEGVAIEPSEGRVTAPFDGTVYSVFPTLHAISLVSNNGTEVIIHVGIDTVSLNGQGFKAHVKNGDTVQAGDLLLEFDIDYIHKQNLKTITPVLVTNMNDMASVTVDAKEHETIRRGEPLMHADREANA
jgi:PTS system beta-glucosides-specific IIC component